jgi:hypothetical protein
LLPSREAREIDDGEFLPESPHSTGGNTPRGPSHPEKVPFLEKFDLVRDPVQTGVDFTTRFEFRQSTTTVQMHRAGRPATRGGAVTLLETPSLRLRSPVP